jgi:hypothetical protein
MFALFARILLQENENEKSLLNSTQNTLHEPRDWSMTSSITSIKNSVSMTKKLFSLDDLNDHVYATFAFR